MTTNTYTLITGASSGIGLALAKRLASSTNLVLVARRGEILRQFQTEFAHKFINPNIIVIEADLSDPASPKRIFNELQAQNIQIDCLVNNAGSGLFGDFKDTDLQQELDIIQLNITSLVVLTKLFLPIMLKNNHGKIINIGSMAGFAPGAKMSIYYATKAFVNSFSEALTFELRKTNLQVITVAPGPTATEFEKASQLDDSKLFTSLYVMTAEQVVDEILKAKTSKMVVPGWINKFMLQLPRILPHKFVIWFTAKIQESK